MKQCPLCGNMMPDDANFCPACMGDKQPEYYNEYINNSINYNTNYAPPPEIQPPPFVVYNDTANSTTFSVTQIAEEYGKSAVWLNSYLRDKGVQVKQNGIWVLTSAFSNQGYTASKYYNINGSVKKQHTYWTPRGKEFICRLLESDGYFKVEPKLNQYPVHDETTNNLVPSVDKAKIWELALSAIAPPFGFIYGAVINKTRPGTSQKLFAAAVVGLIFRGIFGMF